jgi:hypothetical protein
MLILEKEEYIMSATILMAVSTFNGRNYPGMERGDSFQGVGNDGKDITIDDCKSQGESVVRYFLKLMPSDDEVDIVMLCSRKTLEKDEKNGIDNKGNIYSAVSYLIERIDRSPEKGKHKINYKVIKLYKNELPVEHRLQEMDDIDPSIPLMPATKEEEIHFPEDELGAISEAAEFIRYKKLQEKRSFRLYIDTHGGLRDVVLSLSAVISLLSVGESIRPKLISGINMALARIEDQSATFNIFNFFSGINDFLHFGNADILSEYFDMKKDVSYLAGADPIVQKTAKQIVKHMQKISLGAQMSDPKAFLEGLKELGNEFEKNGGSSLKGTTLGIFEKKIKDEYGSLLTNPNILDLIIWCIDHGLIQQALTFIESMLPYYYWDKKLLYFDKEQLKKFDEDAYIAFNRYIGRLRFNQQKSNKELNFFAYHLLENTGEYDVTWARPRNTTLRYYHPEDAAKGEDLEAKSKWINYDNYGNVKMEDFRNKVVPLLQSHRILKIIRNSFNHGNSEYRVSLPKLKMFIINYISDLKKAKK